MANILTEFYCGRVDTGLIKNLLRDIKSKWDAIPAKGNAVPEHLFDQQIDDFPDDLLCQGPAIIDNEATLTRVVDATTFFRCNLNLLTKIVGPPDDREIVSVCEKGIERHRKPDSMIRGNRTQAWVTKRAELENALQKGKKERRANSARNWLGLRHYGIESALLRLDYPESLSRSIQLNGPTVLDAGTSYVYCSANHANGWGAAVRLTNYEDGLPEAVHPQTPFEGGFTAEYLGRVKPYVEIDPAKLEERMLHLTSSTAQEVDRIG